MSWEEIAAKKKERLYESIPEPWRVPKIKESMIYAGYKNTCDYLNSILPSNETEITSLSLVELSEKISIGTYSAFQITEAFCHRACLSHQIVNCCVEIFVDEALEKAKKLDKYFKETGKLVGPLHGIPISLKDQVDLEGKDSSIGYVSLLNKPAKETALLANILEENGAIFYVKTAVPMAMMIPDTFSNVVGYTSNSININLSSGGSSGGEGSLVGSGGSVLGFGTDIGGSIRIPSAFQGLYALKPSVGRITYLNVSNSYAAQELIPSVLGPMGKSLRDIESITKLIVSAKAWDIDPKVLPIPWRDMGSIKEKPLVFGFWKHDGKLTPHPPIQRALNEVQSALVKKGHKVVEIDFPSTVNDSSALGKVFGADSGFDVERICAQTGEPIEPLVKEMLLRSGYEKPIDVNEWWELSADIYKIKQIFYMNWKNSKIDAIICPVWESTSFLPKSPYSINYTSPFNLLDCCSVVLPVTEVDPTIDIKDESYKPLNDVDAHVYKSYDTDLFDGMPVCLQVVGKPLEEEKTLVVASVLEDCIRSS